MFALRRSSLRLATSVPFLRPPRISAPFSDQPPPQSPPDPFASRPSSVFGSPPPNPFATSPPAEGTLQGLFHDVSTTVENEVPSEINIGRPRPPSASPLPHDYENPFGSSAARTGIRASTENLAPAPVPAYRFHCFSSRTNTRTTFTDPDGNVIAWFSGGSCGFKKRNRSSYEAGYQCAVRMFAHIGKKAEEVKSMNIDLFFKGFGQGRDALMKALTTAQGDGVRDRIVSITDRSPLKIGGTRARKQKRR